MNQTVPAESLDVNQVRTFGRRLPNRRLLLEDENSSARMDPSVFAFNPGAGAGPEWSATGRQTSAERRCGNDQDKCPRWRSDFFRRSFGLTTPFASPGIELKPFVIDYRHATNSVIDFSFRLDAPAGKDGFIRAEGDPLVKGNGQPIRFWGFNVTERSRGSTEVPSQTDALARTRTVRA